MVLDPPPPPTLAVKCIKCKQIESGQSIRLALCYSQAKRLDLLEAAIFELALSVSEVVIAKTITERGTPLACSMWSELSVMSSATMWYHRRWTKLPYIPLTLLSAIASRMSPCKSAHNNNGRYPQCLVGLGDAFLG